MSTLTLKNEMTFSVDSMCLIADLLLGCGVGRCLGGGFGPAFEQQVALRGFSASLASASFTFCGPCLGLSPEVF